MKQILMAFIVIILCLVVSCDKDDETWTSRDRFYVTNLSSCFLTFDGDSRRFFMYNTEEEFGLDELHIAKDKWIMNGLSIKYSPYSEPSNDKDSILELKNYVFYPTRHETVKNDTIHMMYSNHYYEFTDSVLRDMKDSMKVKGIVPQKVKK